MGQRTVISETIIPRQPWHVQLESGCLIGCLSVVALTVGVAAWNLARIASMPGYTSTASALWLALVALMIWESRHQHGSLRAAAHQSVLEVAGALLLRLERDADGRVWFRHGLVYRDTARLRETAIDVATITRVALVGGQAPGSFYAAICYRLPGATANRDSLSLLGREMSEDAAASLATRIARFLTGGGIDLVQSGREWVVVRPAPPDALPPTA